MNNLPVTKEELDRYHNDREIVHLTSLQVIKDFARFGYDIEFPADLCYAYDDLFNQLVTAIRELLANDLSKLYALLYAIDVNETTIKKEVALRMDMPFNDVITHLILERELKKVITREYFSRNH
jgi:hypothetical protein